MALTKNEARERAKKIWGADAVPVPQSVAPDNGRWWVFVKEWIHVLDENGRSDCHAECIGRELIADGEEAIQCGYCGEQGTLEDSEQVGYPEIGRPAWAHRRCMSEVEA